VFREREFENLFYSLDCYTANLDFPRKEGHIDEDSIPEGKKRQKVKSDTVLS
jgi:hypothetical protein